MNHMTARSTISLYATDDEQRAFVRSLTYDDLIWWANQQQEGAKNAELADDRASHARGAELAEEELQRRATALHEAVATDLLPDLPDTEGCDSGYDWIEQLRGTGWREIAGNADGCLFGDWPYQVVAHHNDPDRELYGLAVYTEGDVRIAGFRDKDARSKATDAYLEDEDDEDV
jgi:hypothetical protein